MKHPEADANTFHYALRGAQAAPPVAFNEADSTSLLSECTDKLGRPLKDLRLSVIDQCNFRCTYCMPKEVFTKDFPFLSSTSRMSFDQMTFLVKSFVMLGVEKIRITGGEPLLRKGLEILIERLARLRTPEGKDIEIALTTNGSLLAAKARSLRDAGLQRVTVSLDSLDDAVFQRMNDVGFPVARVLEGIEAATAAGLSPVKVNTVVEKGVNENQILPIARYFRNTGVIVRFIEFMDVGGAASWARKSVFTSDDSRRLIESEFALQPQLTQRANETACNFDYADGAGSVGFISSVSQPFCGDCTRARVSADGKMFTCLFATGSFDLKPWLGEALAPEALARKILGHWRRRDDRYSELRGVRAQAGSKKVYPTVRMSLVGG
ncbi:GTP 3',8-cyclase MoaA [Pararobbsia alpina]|uniref:GTP 3',8-cyclase n=1 Tax=Pararobbsia alpina TaxID=621374 RepID=A0A6S7BJE8_9BURK|nr:GTP 3',8-cyclase MoaA [Pararobbsia alpina]CAB3793260.1 GTP 3',8-cyclase [Pararobbsia alpina]